MTEILGHLDSIIQLENCSSIILAGDLNFHFARNNRFTQTVQEYFSQNNLEVFWGSSNENIQAIDYTHMSKNGNRISFSTIDHFVSNKSVLDATTDAGVIHSPLNSSSHSPIFVKLEVGRLNKSIEQVPSLKRVCWSKATEKHKNDYCDALTQY